MGIILFFTDKGLYNYINRVKIIIWISDLKIWIHLSIHASRKTYFLCMRQPTGLKKNRLVHFCTTTNTNIPCISFYPARAIFATRDTPKFGLKPEICFFFFLTTNEFLTVPIRTNPGRIVGLTLWAG